ncbi:DNA-binding protein [human gut metagenome]|uniref:DNA-binding protein n=1 Tax=human gut metagenome TaxID=408170 RepID=K1TSD7_9ZZZZ
MELKYDIYMLNNAQGTGEKRQYIRIVQHEPMTEKQLQDRHRKRPSRRFRL